MSASKGARVAAEAEAGPPASPTSGPASTATFAESLRSAIGASGLSLERISRRLRERGVELSAATLSYWQSGRSAPSRRGSRTGLAELEQILQVPAGSLQGLVPVRSSAPRAPTAPLFSTAPAIKPGMTYEQINELLNRLRGTWLERLSEQSIWTIGPDRTVRSRWMRRIIQSKIDGLDRTLQLEDKEDSTASSFPRITTGAHCTLGHYELFPDQLFVVELLFDRVLGTGDSIMYDYEWDYGPNYPNDEMLDYVNATFLRHFTWELRFHPDALPTRCEQMLFGPSSGLSINRLHLNANHSVTLVQHDMEPTHFIVRWFWD